MSAMVMVMMMGGGQAELCEVQGTSLGGRGMIAVAPTEDLGGIKSEREDVGGRGAYFVFGGRGLASS